MVASQLIGNTGAELMQFFKCIYRHTVLLFAGFVAIAPLQAAGQMPRFTERELLVLASAQYYEIQSFVVQSCSTRFDVDYGVLQRKFDARYGDFFEKKLAEARRVFSVRGVSYDVFIEKTLRGPKQMLSKSFCFALEPALLNRIEHVETVRGGINTQMKGLEPLRGN